MERQADTPWQNDVNTVASMVQALLLKNEFCDVVFQVGTDGETEQIKSHRALLAARSSVFATMFFGSVPENKAFVEVTDTSPDIFKLMLKFVYSDDTAGINVRNLIDMYGVAHKYDIIPLKKFCADQVKNCISMETIGEFLQMNEIYDVAVIRQHCSNFIEANAWKLFQKEEYYVDLPQKHLMYIWQYDTFPEGTNKLPEIDIFKGAITWAKTECERQGLYPDDPKNQRQVLGPAVDLICFPRMSLSEFHEVATKDGLLTWEEFSQMTLYMVNAKDAKLAIGRPAPKTNSAVKTGDRECVRLSDGRLVEIQRGLLQDAIAGKAATCGCDCNATPKKQCRIEAATCGCDCWSNPQKQCELQLAKCGCDCQARPKKRCRFQGDQLSFANSHSCLRYQKDKRMFDRDRIRRRPADGLETDLE